jgi:hypothetical protein
MWRALRITAGQSSELILIDVPLRWRPVGVWADDTNQSEKGEIP